MVSCFAALSEARLRHMKDIMIPGPSPPGGQWCPDPPFEIVAPHFTFGPPVAAYIQYCILKMCPSPSWFSALFLVFGRLLLNPGDGPVRCSINQLRRHTIIFSKNVHTLQVRDTGR